MRSFQYWEKVFSHTLHQLEILERICAFKRHHIAELSTLCFVWRIRERSVWTKPNRCVCRPAALTLLLLTKTEEVRRGGESLRLFKQVRDCNLLIFLTVTLENYL